MTNLDICIPTRDYRAGIRSITVILETALRLRRDISWHIALGGFVVQTRSSCIEQLKKNYPDQTHAWSLWIDDDIIINDTADRLTELILEAEKKQLSFAADVRTLMPTTDGSTRTVLFKDKGNELYTDDEIRQAKDFELKVIHSGLGLNYIYTPLNYRFHWTENGEDTNFFLDNPEIDMRYCRLGNAHVKTIFI